ncbi:MAG: hypothetical protein PVF83_11500 [Anaerolineales bacterium]|jgi:hypothetical protein
MTKETPSLTNLNEKIKEVELAWIRDNHTIFQDLAETEYDERGRGFILVNTVPPSGEKRNSYWYLAQAVAEELEGDELKQMVRAYDPLSEFVLVLEKQNGVCSYHQVKIQKE